VAGAEPLWRAIAVYRFASIGYAVLLVVINRADYSRPGWAWVGARDRDLIGETTDRLSAVVRTLEESAGQASAPLAGQLRRAIEELDVIIQAARTSITPITPPRRTGEEDARP
jgi:hypothetical protein